jgi:hypothetical protein
MTTTKRSRCGAREMLRSRKPISLLALICLVGLTVLLLRRPEQFDTSLLTGHHAHEENEPLPPTNAQSHPIYRLISSAQSEFQTVRARQSRSLNDAVAEYRRRYKLPPPPNFDKWYEFAKRKGVEMIDEYDTIYHSLLPFWALEPSVIRERTREVLGFDNVMIATMIRNGKVTKVEGGGDGAEWHRDATKSMLSGFIEYLPDMDLAFNVHDEPRVVLQHDDLAHHVAIAKDKNIPIAYAKQRLVNGWSPRPSDLGDGDRLKEYKTTRFNHFAHQPTWTNSRLSCSPLSPARYFLNDTSLDNTTSFTTSSLGFIYNTTAFSDICNSPSMQRTFGFFDRPNAFDITHDLFPIFSQSKISSFQDILYPSPWYWIGKVPYSKRRDIDWTSKANKMFWRGSTTGGFSRDGGWRRQHRQRFVQHVNGLDNAKILKNTTGNDDAEWVEVEVPKAVMKDYFDVKFTYVGQCDPGDCDAQKEFFDIVEPVNQYDAFDYKYLLDIDGNAFSGRYYAFLQSKSLVYKLAIFREWHDEWLKAWVHYIPLSLKGDEYVEAIRYFDQEEAGRLQAKAIANDGREWSEKVLRNDDLEVWYFRLLLEYALPREPVDRELANDDDRYGRLIDDNRYNIGFSI